jgi:predicted AlkP superfamily pyrophosphatase or phosphodiesterase
MQNLRRCITALIWLTLIAPHAAALSEPMPTPKVVFVIVDGIPADVIERVATPHLDAIASAGAYARAQIGGPVGEPGETPTVSAPGYMSLVTGTWADKHNVYENYNLSPNYDYWNIFRVAKAVSPAIKIGIFSTWTDNRTVLLGEGQPGAGDWRFDYVADSFEKDEKRFPPQPSDKHIALIDTFVAEEAAKVIVEQGPGLTWVYLQHTDDIGHEFGDSDAFDLAVAEMDDHVGRIWDAVNARQATHPEDWLVIVTTDHGRDAETGREHEGHTARERTIWIATNSQRLSPDFYAMPEIVDIYPSIATHLGITIPEEVARHLDGASFIQ